MQKLMSSKRIAPTDNMWPKSDDAIWHHWWLKGLVKTGGHLLSWPEKKLHGMQPLAKLMIAHALVSPIPVFRGLKYYH